ncbi:MAG TPA: anthranilate phosphoribosyltransferase [Pseudomonadales bacterium]|nr:anthranilate phosphoribosyltransferase [Pseudomonadales bacterium]
MDIKAAIATLLDGHSLTREQMHAVMHQVMTGGASEAQIAGLLIALRMKGESVDEIAAAATVMRELATPVHIDIPNAVDIVGTGGDGASIFNVSTASTFVAAAAGAHVAKHGNRSVSSSSGAADLLEAAGVNLALESPQVAQCIHDVGVGFMFAVNHHSAMKHAIGPRRELGVRTIFNVLGPLTNPAGVKHQLVGVYDTALCRPLAEVLHSLGSQHALVVHSEDGLDELSIAAPSLVVELHKGRITEYTIAPEDFGMTRHSLADLVVTNAAESLALIERVLAGEICPAADMVALNAGAALYAADIVENLAAGVALAQETLGSGRALQKMRDLAALSRRFAS